MICVEEGNVIVKILIADDHLLVREGIKQLLELEGDMLVIGEANNGVECLKMLERLEPDIVLLDINMPVMNGLEVLKRVCERRLNIKVLVLTIHNEVEYLIRAIDIGIDGYMLKDSDSSLLKKAIYKIIDGGSYIQPSLTPALNAKLLERGNEKRKLLNLTNRELEVLKLLACGMYNKEIGLSLVISERTVKNHISNIFKKLGVADRTQAAVFALQNNIVRKGDS